MYGYMPTTAEVRYVYKFGAMPEMDDRPRVVAEMELEFDRWLAEHDREVEARAIERAADSGHFNAVACIDLYQYANKIREEIR